MSDMSENLVSPVLRWSVEEIHLNIVKPKSQGGPSQIQIQKRLNPNPIFGTRLTLFCDRNLKSGKILKKNLFCENSCSVPCSPSYY